MIRNSLFASIATIAVVAASPTLAKPGGGMGGGIGASMNSGRSVGAGATMRGSAGARGLDAQLNAHGQSFAKGRVNARNSLNNGTDIDEDNDTDIDEDNDTDIDNDVDVDEDIQSNIVTGSRIRASDLNGTSSSRISAKSKARLSGQNQASLSGGLKSQLSLQVTPGMTVTDSGGATVGTVTGIRTVGNGAVKSVQVTLTDGSVIVLSGNSLTANGDVLVTNSLTTNVNSQGAAHASINGLIHANPRSALGAAGVTTLTGLTTGLTVNGTGGTSVGTVSSVLVNRAGAVVGINVDLTAGGTVTIPATTLSMNGTIVETTFLP